MPLIELLNSIDKLKVLVVGDIILDEYMWGNVSRISPEAPVQVLESISENVALGGAANVANNLISLDCDVCLVGSVGMDEKGEKVINLLEKAGINSDGVVREPNRPTTNKMRIIAHNQQILRVDKETKNDISEEGRKYIIDYVRKTIPDVDGIICSDYQKGILGEKILKSIIHTAKKYKKKIIVDPKGSDYSKYKGCTIITPNEVEVQNTSLIKINSKEDMERSIQYLFGLLKCEAILVTKGKDGMSLFYSNGDAAHIPTEAKEVYDVTGAGDTVISVFGMAVFKGCKLLDAVKVANKAAGIVVGKVGTSVVTKKELIYYLEEGQLFLKNKVVELTQLIQIVNLARNQGRKIVFTNGCFDLIHIGHIKYLQQARMLGDLLIVALNDDESVRIIKGNARPLISQYERANILSALDCINYVVVFPELTPEILIREIKPDILVKGGDYSIKEVVGRDIVESYGGKVELIPVVKGISTSLIVERIVKKYKE